MKSWRLHLRLSALALLAYHVQPCAQPDAQSADAACGELISLAAHQSASIRYAYHPSSHAAKGEPVISLVLLVGGNGYLNLDEQVCPRSLKGNSLVRSLPLFEAHGFNTALMDAPSDWLGPDGLAGFRSASAHADDIGVLIRQLREKTGGKVWLVGTSRGTISAANAASRLSGLAAPDGVVLTSALTSGHASAKKSWVAQTVFDFPLENIKMPVLVLGHASDMCARSPATLMNQIIARVGSARKQSVTMQGGDDKSGASSLQVCEGYSAHGYIGQEKEMLAIIANFIRNVPTEKSD